MAEPSPRVAQGEGRESPSRLGRRFRPLDALLALALLFAAYQAWPAFSAGPGRRAEVVGPEGTLARLTLAGKTRSLTLPGALGPVTVEAGSRGVRFAQAPCPGQLCVKRGWVKRAGGTSSCLPSRLRIVVEGGPEVGGDPESLDAETW